MYDTLDLSRDDRGVATLTLNRPEKHNAMSGQMLQELQAAARALAADKSVHVRFTLNDLAFKGLLFERMGLALERQTVGTH